MLKALDKPYQYDLSSGIMIATIQLGSEFQAAAPRLVATHRRRTPAPAPYSESRKILKPVAQNGLWHKTYPVAQDGMRRKDVAQDDILCLLQGNSEDLYSNIFYYILLYLTKLIL